MGKQGPCCHCGISTTPLWRNGPPEKPVLCNACGSRWKTKGTLLNYMPMHSGGFGANTEASSDLKWSRGRKGSHKHAEQRSHKRKEPCDPEREIEQLRADQSFSSVHEEEGASRSCSGSGMSNSEGSIKRSSSSTIDLPVLGTPWNAPIPSKKRSATLRLRTPVDKLTRSLTSMFVDPASVAHPVPSSSSEALLVEYNKPSLVALEIGLGSVFVRQPVSMLQESESETTSFFMESKSNDSFNALGDSELEGGTPLSQVVNVNDRGSALRGKEKAKQVPRKPEAGPSHSENNLIPNKSLLENFSYSKRDLLQSSQSSLALMDMKVAQNKELSKGKLKGPSFPGAATSAFGGSYGAKQLLNCPSDMAEEEMKTLKTNSFTGTSLSALPAVLHNTNPMKHGLIIKPEMERSSSEVAEMEAGSKIESTCFLSNSPFNSSAERAPTIGEEYLDIGALDSGEADSLLFDVPNPMSFQQAELLHQPSWTKSESMKEEENDAAQLESGGLIMSNTWHTDTQPEWSLFWNSSCVGPAQALPNGTVLNPNRSNLPNVNFA